MIDGKLVWLQEEDRNEDISIALIIREQFFTSELFKDILEAISLILRYRTMCWLELEYYITFIMWEAISIFIQLSAMDWYLEARIWAEDNLCSSCLLIQETKVTKTLNILTSLYFDEARTSGATVHFASLMDICHLKNCELETKHQKYKGRVERRFRVIRSIHWTRIFSISNDSS